METTASELRLRKNISTVQFTLRQKDQVKVLAFAAFNSFDLTQGPSASPDLSPQLTHCHQMPDFDKILAGQDGPVWQCSLFRR